MFVKVCMVTQYSWLVMVTHGRLDGSIYLSTVPNRNEYTPGTMSSIFTPFLTNSGGNRFHYANRSSVMANRLMIGKQSVWKGKRSQGSISKSRMGARASNILTLILLTVSFILRVLTG